MSMRPPDGYIPMPLDITCRGCFQQWKDGDHYYCCGRNETVKAIAAKGADVQQAPSAATGETK